MAAPPPQPQQIGTETRSQILPVADPAGPGFLGPKYDPSDFVPLPGDIGVRRGGDLSDVTNAISGVAYYADTIGFGESTNPLTRGMNFQHFGVNYFMKTGAKCSNGADMWMYVETIPRGDALGKKVQKGLASAGLPAMRGLAPGMLEDVQSALDPRPVIGAMFGGAYPSCKQVTKPVGDEKGRISDPESGDMWVEGPVTMVDGRPHQIKWIQDKDISREAWEKAPKTMKPDGTPIAAAAPAREGFTTEAQTAEIALVTSLLLATTAVLWFRFRK